MSLAVSENHNHQGEWRELALVCVGAFFKLKRATYPILLRTRECFCFRLSRARDGFLLARDIEVRSQKEKTQKIRKLKNKH